MLRSLLSILLFFGLLVYPLTGQTKEAASKNPAKTDGEKQEQSTSKTDTSSKGSPKKGVAGKGTKLRLRARVPQKEVLIFKAEMTGKVLGTVGKLMGDTKFKITIQKAKDKKGQEYYAAIVKQIEAEDTKLSEVIENKIGKDTEGGMTKITRLALKDLGFQTTTYVKQVGGKRVIDFQASIKNGRDLFSGEPIREIQQIKTHQEEGDSELSGESENGSSNSRKLIYNTELVQENPVYDLLGLLYIARFGSPLNKPAEVYFFERDTLKLVRLKSVGVQELTIGEDTVTCNKMVVQLSVKTLFSACIGQGKNRAPYRINIRDYQLNLAEQMVEGE